ncbi:MAG: hypothetical protein ISR77_37105 [Pirellulaceae bacterium]|nr:hypothetical protein [Pirellulaceae bacterium]
MNVGEEICGEWLRHVKGCEFVQYNLKTMQVQGEIDVIGINLSEHTVYACEVALHLVTGLQYVKNRRPDNVPRLTAKFRKDISYIRSAFADYNQVFMFWSPVVKDQREGAKYNQLRDVRDITAAIEEELGVAIDAIVNQRFQDALDELRAAAKTETKELDSAVMRYLQVEEHLRRHLRRLD